MSPGYTCTCTCSLGSACLHMRLLWGGGGGGYVRFGKLCLPLKNSWLPPWFYMYTVHVVLSVMEINASLVSKNQDTVSCW